MHKPSPLSTLAGILIFSLTTATSAETLPSFAPEMCTWEASDIVIATQDGKSARILETWKGRLAPGTSIQVELSLIARDLPSWATTNGKERTGKRVVIFLKHPPQDAKPPAKPDAWSGAGFDAFTSMVWIEDGKPYAFVQEMNPGDSVLTLVAPAEADFKAATMKILDAQEALHKAQAIADPESRLQALLPMVTNDLSWHLREEALAAVGNCGSKALPTLRKMLHDHRYDQSNVCSALAAAAGPDAGSEMTSLLEAETAYWRQEAPKLPVGWWNNSQSQQLTEDRRDRYCLLGPALDKIATLHHAPARKLVRDLRDLWTSLPQLNDKSGLDHIIQACDTTLHALNTPATAP